MTNIFVARLDYGVTQEELKSAFEQYGQVNKVSLAIDKETGKSKGFAFIEMKPTEVLFAPVVLFPSVVRPTAVLFDAVVFEDKA